VFQNPVLTTTRIAETLDTTLQSALNHVRRLEAAGIVSEARGVPGRSKRWISTEVFHTVDPDASAEFSNGGDSRTLPDHAGTTGSQ